MSNQDRRSGSERRAATRYPVDFNVEWECDGRRAPGAMSDVSLGGCFILSSGDVEDGEPVRVFIPLDDGMKVEFNGRIANHVVEIGFGIEFEQLSMGQRDLLVAILHEAKGT